MNGKRAIDRPRVTRVDDIIEWTSFESEKAVSTVIDCKRLTSTISFNLIYFKDCQDLRGHPVQPCKGSNTKQKKKNVQLIKHTYFPRSLFPVLAKIAQGSAVLLITSAFTNNYT